MFWLRAFILNKQKQKKQMDLFAILCKQQQQPIQNKQPQ